MRNAIYAKSNLMYIVFLLLLVTLCSSCAKTKPGMIVTPYYESVLVKENTAESKIPVTIRVNAIEFDPPGKKTNGGATVLKIFPLLSLIPVYDQNFYNTNPEASVITTREPGEIEKVLTEELKKTFLFNEVSFEGAPKDYDIQGKVDFILDVNSHYSGFGILLSPISLLFFPMGNFDYKCEAHFEVVSTSDNSILLSKDYFYKKRFLMGLLYSGNIIRAKKVFGKKVFPIIVEKFINDLKSQLKQKI